MKNFSMLCCLQHKAIIINVVVIFIFVINTVFFHAYQVEKVKDEIRDIANVKLNARIGSSRSFVRVQEKRSTSSNNRFGTSVDPTQVKMSDNWIIVSLAHFNKSWGLSSGKYLSFLDSVHDWTSVVVGDAANSNHGCESCLAHPTKAHQDPNTAILNALATAIRHGARQIYVMTSLHNVTSALRRMTSPNIQGIVYSGKMPFKPCTHFAQPLLSSGRSFSQCHDRNWMYTYSIDDFPGRNIIGMCEECGQTFLASDSIDGHQSNGTVYCDASTPNVAVKLESFAESGFENSLWFYDSFWAMFFYGTKYDALSLDTETLKMSFIAQRLLWEINVAMSFIRSHDLDLKEHGSVINKFPWIQGIEKERKYNDIESKLCREKELNREIRILEKFLYKWSCNQNLTIEKCVLDLTDDLVESKLITEEQYRTVCQFIKMLESISYVYPDRSHGPVISVGSYIGSKSKTLRFWPASENRHWSQNPFHHFCSRFDKTSMKIIHDTLSISSLLNEGNKTEKIGNIPNNIPRTVGREVPEIVLVVVFKSNDPAVHIQMVNFYDFMYGRHFRHIVYCTSGTENIEMFAKMYPQPMTVVDLKDSNSKLYSYLCMSEVMRMYHSSVRGYLHIDSETLLNPWTIGNLHSYLDKPWINSGTMKTKLFQPEVHTANVRVGQMWRDKDHGRRALNNSIQDLLFISKIIDKHIGTTNATSNKDIVQYLTKYNKVVKTFLASFNTTKLSQFEILYGMTLVYFVPADYREQFIVLADEFSRYSVHSHIVVPTIIKSLDSNFLELTGRILTTRHTTSILSAYKTHHTYLYPWEMYLLPGKKRSKFMCTTYLPQVEASLINNVV